QPEALPEAWPEHRMGMVGTCLREVLDAVPPRHVAVAEATQLREHEPHPVAPLATGAELGEHVLVDRCLRVHEPGDARRVFHRAIVRALPAGIIGPMSDRP